MTRDGTGLYLTMQQRNAPVVNKRASQIGAELFKVEVFEPIRFYKWYIDCGLIHLAICYKY